MIGRILWLAVLGSFAILTALLQLDKQTQTSPELAAAVPEPLRNFAQTQITLTALKGNDPETALAQAKLLVSRRPVPAEYLSLLAVAQSQTDQAEQSSITIQIAGQRGWREPLAQEAVLRLALATGDEAEAARRYAALFLQTSTPQQLLVETGAQVLGKAGSPGRETMTGIVTGGERWHNLFLRRGVIVMPTDAFSDIAAASLARGAEFSCTQLTATIKELGRRDVAAAERLAKAAKSRCP